MTEMVQNMTIEGEEQTVPERSGWERPDTLAKLLTGLLATLVVVLTFMATTLSAIKADARFAADTALVSKVNLDNLKEELADEKKERKETWQKLDNRIDTVEKGYRFNASNRLSYLEAKTGFKAPPQKKDEEE